MTLPKSALAECMRETFTPLISEALARAVVKGNRAAMKMALPIKGLERRDMFGHVERACIEKELKGISATLPDVTYEHRATAKKTAHYVELKIGNVLVTSSAVDFPGQLPRPADYRNALALSGQTTLFRLLGEPEASVPSEGCIHAILTHCTANDGSVVDARVVVPNHTGKRRLFTVLLQQELADAIEYIDELPPEEQVDELQLEKLAPAARRSTTG